MIYIIVQVRWKSQGVSYVASKCPKLWLTNGLKLDQSFYPTLVFCSALSPSHTRSKWH